MRYYTGLAIHKIGALFWRMGLDSLAMKLHTTGVKFAKLERYDDVP